MISLSSCNTKRAQFMQLILVADPGSAVVRLLCKSQSRDLPRGVIVQLKLRTHRHVVMHNGEEDKDWQAA